MQNSSSQPINPMNATYKCKILCVCVRQSVRRPHEHTHTKAASHKRTQAFKRSAATIVGFAVASIQRNSFISVSKRFREFLQADVRGGPVREVHVVGRVHRDRLHFDTKISHARPSVQKMTSYLAKLYNGFFKTTSGQLGIA
jgi:hypothetical protein